MDICESAAQYYDQQDNPTADIPFYAARLPSAGAHVLELGCGTGRVLLPLASSCGYIHGMDSSAAMLARCREKVERARLSPERVQLTLGDIARFELRRRFDLIIAPFRVLQNLETEGDVHGLMGCIRDHLARSGSAILNVFQPKLPPDELRRAWCEPGERQDGETTLADGSRLVWSHRRVRLSPDPLIVYPELIYRHLSATGELLDESVLPIAMRCWYPSELERLVVEHGFRVIERLGGYEGEAWGSGPELVIQFELGL